MLTEIVLATITLCSTFPAWSLAKNTGVDCHTKHMDGKSEVIFAFGESWEHFIDYVIWVNHGENRVCQKLCIPNGVKRSCEDEVKEGYTCTWQKQQTHLVLGVLNASTDFAGPYTLRGSIQQSQGRLTCNLTFAGEEKRQSQQASVGVIIGITFGLVSIISVAITIAVFRRVICVPNTSSIPLREREADEGIP